MKISIVIVNYKVKFFLEQALLSVRNASQGIDSEVFVVDNNSQDDSISYLKPLFPEVRFIENSENVGFARANNQAIALSSGEYVLLLNPDTLIGEDVLRQTLKFMDCHPEAGGVGVKMMDSNGRFLPESKRSIPTPWVSFCKIFGLTKMFPKSRFFARYNLGYLDENRILKIEVLAGAFMMLRREALNVSGLLDEQFFMYGEDIDLSYRIMCNGYENYYLPLRILHYKGESTPKHTIRYVRIFYQAMDIFFRKHYPHLSFWYAFAIRFAIVFKAILAAFYRFGFWCLRPFLKFRNNKRRHILIFAGNEVVPAIRHALFRKDIDDEFYPFTFSERDTNAQDESLRQYIRSHEITDVVLSDSALLYGDMLQLMEKLNREDVDFSIHSSKARTIVSSNNQIKLDAYA